MDLTSLKKWAGIEKEQPKQFTVEQEIEQKSVVLTEGMREIFKQAGIQINEAVDDSEDDSEDDSDDSDDDKPKKKKVVRHMFGGAEMARITKTIDGNQPKEKEHKEPKEKLVRNPDEPVKRGAIANPNSNRQMLAAFIKNHGDGPKMRTKAWEYNLTLEKPYTKAGFSTIFQSLKGTKASKEKVDEGYIIRHPSIPSYVLHENVEMNLLQWVNESHLEQPLMFFEDEMEARKIMTFLLDFKNQQSVLEKVILDQVV